MKYFFVTFIPKFFKGFAIFAPAIKKYPQKEKEQKKIRLSDAFSALFFSLFLPSKKSFFCKEITIGIFVIANGFFQQYHQIIAI